MNGSKSPADPDANWPAELDAMIAAPAHHVVLFENEHVRVLDTHVGPGETTPVHTHRWPGVLYFLGSSHFVRHDGDGRVLVDSRVDGSMPTPGAAVWIDALAPHFVENVGSSELRAIAVEWKRGAPG